MPSAAHVLPPARSRSTSSSEWAPKSFAWEPLGQRTTVPPVVVMGPVAVGSCALIPDGPVTQAVTASPWVGPMMPIQCGTGPDMQGGPATCWAT